MSLRIGRVGLDITLNNVAQLDADGDTISISGRIDWEGGPQVQLAREQILNLPNNVHEPFVPVVYDEYPKINGYYYVESVSVEMGPGSVQIGYFPFSATLRKVPNYSAPLLESRMFGMLRGNVASITTSKPFTAVPASAMGWVGPASATAPETRYTATGQVLVYSEAASATPSMVNAFTSFTLDPKDFYDGGCRITLGDADVGTTAVYAYTGSSGSYVVPSGVTQVVVDARGAQGGGSKGGRGARVESTITVTPGETLTVRVGQHPGVPVTGGFPNGGAGRSSGFGGGGRTEIVRSSTRLIVAAGGGGMGIGGGGDGKRYGGDGGDWGAAGPDSDSGDGASTSAGGPGGVGSGGSGSAGSSLQGGAAATYAGSNSGGGGDGRYGGGGGGGLGGGGGGSSLLTGTNGTVYSGFQAGHGQLLISPAPTGIITDSYVVVGDQCHNSPFGWEISNGIVRIVPVFTTAKLSFAVSIWNGLSWGTPYVWTLTDAGSSTTAASVNISGFSILSNTAHEAIVRVTGEYIGQRDTIEATVTLRRGATLADVNINTDHVTAQWGWRLDGTEVGTAVTGQGIVQTTAASDGTKYLIVTPQGATSVLTARVGWYRNVATTYFMVGLGAQPNLVATTPANLLLQWYAAVNESVRPVLR